MANTPAIYGGQAVIEGVMFAGKSVHVTAVRRKDSSIAFLEVPKPEKQRFLWLRKIPFIRGMIGLIDAAANGSKHLQFSMEQFAEDEGEDVEAMKKEAEKDSFWAKFGFTVTIGVAGIISLFFSKALFTAVPAAIEQFLFSSLFANQALHALIEGIIKILILLTYMYLISLTPPIKRLFQYHGAEHKVISCFENNEELTVANVQKYSTLHYRCGSSFMVFTVLVGVIIYSAYNLIDPYTGFWDRIFQRLYLLPIVVGVSYEVLRWTNAMREIPVLRYLGYPGLWLQKLTTREPNDEHVEVAIASFNRMREIDAKGN